MSDLSPRRRLAGRALLGAGLLALPLTASISYAASESRLEAPEPPAPPAPPAPPSAPDAPEPPEAPEAPSILLINADAPEGEGGSHVTERVWRDADGKERRIKIVTRGGTDVESIERQLEGIEGADAADREAMLADMRASLAEADRVLADLPNIISSAMAEAEVARASAPRVIVKHECDGGTEEVTETTTKDGMQIIKICQRRIMASARQGLEEARAEIARDKDIPEDTRKQLLRTLDGQIARWSDKEG